MGTTPASGNTPQLEKWGGAFGDAYTERNPPTAEAVAGRVPGLAAILDHLKSDPPRSILECGCNVGINLRALRKIAAAELFAVEPNPGAIRRVIEDGVLPGTALHRGSLERLPFADGTVDLVFTSGVLIHVSPEALERAYREMFRVSRKYLLNIEYFAKTPKTIPYRGETGLLFKRDFGGLWLDLYPELVPIAEGFFWSRTTGLDDATWWLFRKSRPS